MHISLYQSIDIQKTHTQHPLFDQLLSEIYEKHSSYETNKYDNSYFVKQKPYTHPLLMNWLQQYEIIMKVLSEKLARSGRKFTYANAAQLLGVKVPKIQAWGKGQRPTSDDLETLAKTLDLSTDWLLLGYGSPTRAYLSETECLASGPTDSLRQHPGDYEHVSKNALNITPGTNTLPAYRPQPAQAIPVLGLASCGVDGWEHEMRIAVSTTLPTISDKTVAVIATGDSMLPAGISSGHICLCDPEQQAIPGDAALIRRRDGLATIKIFLGEGEQGPGWLRLKGWLPASGNNQQKEFFIDMLASDVECVAPVIYVRRRI